MWHFLAGLVIGSWIGFGVFAVCRKGRDDRNQKRVER